MKTWPRLYYTNNSGKTYEWDIWVEGDTIFTLYGGEGDSKQEASKQATPKNVGKSNSTTAEEQALLEAEAMWVYQKDRKYSESRATSNIVDKLQPMLAKSVTKLKKEQFPVYVQPKLDGVRCLIRADGDDVEMVSRSGKPIENCEHIRQQVKDMNLPPMVLDGELYIHGMGFQSLLKLVKKYRPGESENVEFHCYDSYCALTKDDNWKNRHDITFLDFPEADKIKLVGEQTCFNEEEVQKAHESFIQQGYEGSIIRLTRGLKDKDLGYRTGARSAALLKKKDFLDAEYSVTGYTEGVGKFVGCIIYECETPEGIKFNVVPKGTMEERQAWYQEADSHIGEKLTVRFFEKTDDGVPRFPVGVGLRWKDDIS